MTLSAPAAAQEAAGDWVGVLDVGRERRLPLVVHIKRDDAGALTGTMDSPAQGATALPLAEIAARADGWRSRFPSVAGD